MAGIPQPFFDWDDSIPDFLVKLRLYLQNQAVDSANNAGGPLTGREVVIGYLRGCMKKRALECQIGNQALNETFGRPGTAIVKLRAVEAEDIIGEHLPLDELAKKLYEIELHRIARHKRNRLPDPLVSNRASQEIYELSLVSAHNSKEFL
ncbi:hypothetical protein RhiirC2_796415 [Rhizophagus irregularis]|uniref:Uncharacterized protein n=1 Tax=Rhizophagus irregularis TaxID=588596 RepID=A0A2N1M9S0_9GLOM|nr:hypothetical protein RhiirC2_796415 [Rhizophagus irregularis]